MDALKRLFGGSHRTGSSAGRAGAPAAEGAASGGAEALRAEWAARVRDPRARLEFEQVPVSAYTAPREVRVLVGTWNVNGRDVKPDLALPPWLPARADGADLVVVGFQEIVPLTAGQVLAVDDPKAVAPWDALLEECLNGAGEEGGGSGFVKVASKQLVGVYLVIWVREPLRKQVRDVRLCTVTCGVLNLFGNKGAAAAWLKFDETTLCIVCAHLSSGSKEGDELRRNADFATVCGGMHFPPPPEAVAAAAADDLPPPTQVSLADAEACIFMGDFNYRIAAPDEEVRAALEAGHWERLVPSDQLVREMAAGRTFVGFQEGALTFAPTYKYRLYSDEYTGSKVNAEEFAKEKRRTPAWCDRITFRGAALQQLAYDRADAFEMRMSDHRPVRSMFMFRTLAIVPEALQRELANVRRRVDTRDTALLPACSLEPNALEFGTVRYGTPATSHVTLRNTGEVQLMWAFVAPGAEEGTEPCPKWVVLEPPEGFLLPGESVDIRVRVSASGCTADLGLVAGPLSEVLVLHVENGRDFFVTVNGTYAGSCFGLPLDDAGCEGVLSAMLERIAADPGDVSQRLVEHAELENALPSPRAVAERADQEAAAEVAAALDDGTGLAQLPASDVLSAMLVWLSSLPAPLLPDSVASVVDVCPPPSRNDALSLLASKAEPGSVEALRRIAATLGKVAAEANPGSEPAVARILSEAVLRAPADADAKSARAQLIVLFAHDADYAAEPLRTGSTDPMTLTAGTSVSDDVFFSPSGPTPAPGDALDRALGERAGEVPKEDPGDALAALLAPEPEPPAAAKPEDGPVDFLT